MREFQRISSFIDHMRFGGDKKCRWAFTGGAAVYLHLLKSKSRHRRRTFRDFDIYSFTDSFLGHDLCYWEVLELNKSHARPLHGSEAPSAYSEIIDVWHSFHFSNIVPNADDVEDIFFDNKLIKILRKEFLIVFKYLPTVWSDEKHFLDASSLVQSGCIDECYLRECISRHPLEAFLPKSVCAQDFVTKNLSEAVDKKIRDCIVGVNPELRCLPIERLRAFHSFNSKIKYTDLEYLKPGTIEAAELKKEEILAIVVLMKTPEHLKGRVDEFFNALVDTSLRRNQRLEHRVIFLHATFWGRYVVPAISKLSTREINLILEGLRADMTPLRFMVQLQALHLSPIIGSSKESDKISRNNE